MSNLVNHAKLELELAGYFDKDGMYGDMIGKAVLELVETFFEQGHSGMSAAIVSQIFTRVAEFKPLTPLTFKEEEWGETGLNGEAEMSFQNKRNSAVFKSGKDDRPYYINAYTMQRDEVNGTCWNGSLHLEGGKRVGKCFVVDPSNLPTITLQVPFVENNPNDAADWDFLPLPESALDELKKYYEVEIVEETQ